jgi:hypothetical protein
MHECQHSGSQPAPESHDRKVASDTMCLLACFQIDDAAAARRKWPSRTGTEIETYLFASSSESLDHLAIQPNRKRCLGPAVWPSGRVSRSVWSHCRESFEGVPWVLVVQVRLDQSGGIFVFCDLE